MRVRRIIESPMLEGTHTDHQVQPLTLHRTAPESHCGPESITQTLPERSGLVL